MFVSISTPSRRMVRASGRVSRGEICDARESRFRVFHAPLNYTIKRAAGLSETAPGRW